MISRKSLAEIFEVNTDGMLGELGTSFQSYLDKAFAPSYNKPCLR